MSVPLDRLYHYLADVVNHDLIIYRWAPHGSRKLEDLNHLLDYPEHKWHHTPTAIFHDQEPLNYNFYTRNQIRDRVKVLFSKGSPEFMQKDSVLDYISLQHLRAVTGCVNHYDLTMLVHSEQRSTQVELFSKKNFVPVYYWSHAVIAQDWFRYAAHDPNLNYNLSNIQQDFLIYNRAWSGTREYRLCFAEQIVEHRLGQCCKMSFNSYDDNEYYGQHQFANPELQITNFNLENFFPANTHSANASADYNNTDYADIGIEVVLETLFDDTRWHLTEKTLRPIACGKPFILVATPGSLQYLRNYGFETFAGLIDESYDNIEHSRDRLDAVVQEMKRIAALSTAAKQVLYTKMYEIAQRNKQHFFNGLAEQVMEEYRINLDQAMNIVQQHCSGQHRQTIRQLMQQN
jgi:hypothetical protein